MEVEKGRFCRGNTGFEGTIYKSFSMLDSRQCKSFPIGPVRPKSSLVRGPEKLKLSILSSALMMIINSSQMRSGQFLACSFSPNRILLGVSMLSKSVRLPSGLSPFVSLLVGHWVCLVSLLVSLVSLLVGHCVRLVFLLSPFVSGLVSLLVGHCVRVVCLLFLFVSLLVSLTWRMGSCLASH